MAPPAPPPACPLCAAPGAHVLHQSARRRWWLCGGPCGLVYVDPAQRPDAAAERAQYDLHRNDPADAGYVRFLGRLVEPLLAALGPAPRQGLDFGCGPGPTLSGLLAAAGHAVADYDPIYRPDVALLARRYDFVTATEVVEHFHEPAREFARLRGLLRPGGLLALMTKRRAQPERFAGWHYKNDPTHVSFYHTDTLGWIAAGWGATLTLPAPDVALLRLPDSPPAD